MSKKFEKKCAIVSFSEEISSRNTPFARLRLIDEEGKQCDAFYFGYVEEDKQHLSDPEAVYDISGVLNEDGTVKVKDITRLENESASKFHKSIYDIKDLSKELVSFIKENVLDEKYMNLLKSTVLTGGTLSKFCKAPFHPVNNHEGSLLDHIGNCLRISKHLMNLYNVKYDLIFDSQAIYCAIILYYLTKSQLEKKGYCNYEFTEKQKVIGEDTMLLHAILSKIEKLEDFVCLVDLLQSIAKRTYSQTLEGRLLNYVMNLDRVMQTVLIALHNKNDNQAKLEADFNGTKVSLFYPSMQ